MGELGEKLWAVVSERGCEASSLAYHEAAQLVSRLRGEKVAGLCIVTDAAARRLTQPPNGTDAPTRRVPSEHKKALIPQN